MADLLRWARDRRDELEDVASRAWDQVNMLDNGRTWQQRTPTSKGSVGQQIQNSAPVRNAGRAVDSVATAKRNTLNDIIDNFSDILDANSKADIAKRVAAGDPASYYDQKIAEGNMRPAQNAGQAFFGNAARLLNTGAGLVQETPATIREAAGLLTGNEEAVANAVNDLNKIQEATRQTNKGVLNAGTIYNSPTEKLNPLDTAKRFIPAYAGAVGETFPIPATKAISGANIGIKAAKVAGASGVANTVADAGQQLAETGRIDPLRSLQAAAAGAALGGIIPLAGYGVKKGFQATDNAAMRAAQANPAMEYGGLNNGARDPNLNMPLNMENIKNRAKNPSKESAPVDPLIKINKNNAQVENQLIKSGVSPAYAKKVVAENDNSFIALNLLGGDKLKNARDPDLYVKSVINKKTGPSRQKTADMLNNKSKTEPRLMGKPEDRPANIDANGEIIEPKSAPKNIDEFVSTLPEAKVTSRADADKLIGEGTDWLRKAGKAIDKRLKADGDSYENFARVINKASDDVKAGIEPNVPKTYQEIYDMIKPALDKFRKASGKETGETPYYLPRRPINGGEQVQMGNSLVDSIDAATFGSAEKRTGALGIEDTDLTPEGLGSYATQTLGERYRHSMAADDLMKAAEKRGKPITQKQASEAVTLQDKLLKGFTQAAKDGKEMSNDTVGDLNKLGKAEGIEPVQNAYKPGKLLQSPEHMLKGGRVWENGFKQYDYSIANANTFIGILKKNKVPASQFGDALRKSITTQMPNADKDVINKAVANAVYLMKKNDVAPRDAAGFVNMAIRTVAKEEMIKLGKSTAFLDGKMSQVVSEQINGRVLNSIHETNFLQAADSFVTERVNVALRGLNVMSAFFELGDIANVFSNYGLKNLKQTQGGIGPIKGDTLYFSHKYGQANASFMTPDMPEVNALNKIWDDPNTSLTKKMYESYRSVENKLLVFRYIEQHKTELFFRTADKYHKQQGLRGNDLVTAVMDDYKTTMLPHTLGTANRLLGKMPKILTQYMNWGLQATKRLGRTVTGSNKAGIYKDMSRPSRIGVGITTELAPKAITAAVVGVPLMQILGMRDFTGATSADFTGIDDEDKNTVDKAVQLMSVSPVIGAGANFYYANRRNQIADARKAAGEEYRSERKKEDTPVEVAKQSASMLVPFRTQAQKTKDVYDASKRGYFENREGRIQANAPQGVKAIPGAIFGKGYTKEMREYQDNPNIATVISGKAKPIDLIKKNETVNQLSQNILNKNNRDFNRPLSASIKNKDGSIAAKGYSDMAKDAHNIAVKNYGKNSKEANKVLNDWIKNGREYNKLTDNLKKNNPTAYDSWLKTKDGDVLTPEKWRVYAANKDVFAFDKRRKELEKRDLGRVIDPIYELQEDRANMVLQERSVATGDDMTLRAKLYKEDWYAGKFKDDEAKYFDSFEGQRDESGKSQRVKDWNAMNTQLFSPEKGVIKKYGLVEQYQNEIDKFADYNSQERKDFTKNWYATYGDAYTAQKDAYDQERYALVNKMRKLEKVGEISFDVFKSKLEFPSDSSSSYSGGYARGGSSDGGGSVDTSPPKIGLADTDTPKIKVKTLEAPNFKAKTKKLSVKKIPGSYLNKKLS